MHKDQKDVRLPLIVTRAEADAIDEWRFDNRIASRNEALRRLIAAGLQTTTRPPAATE
ncbi:MAG: hypothetical protein ABSC06_20505 [Rhodopila sp.]|jgi:hypothetical protein